MAIKAFSVLFEKKSHENTQSILNFAVYNKTPGYTKRKKKLVKYKCFLYASVERISTKCSMWDCRQLKNANLAKFFLSLWLTTFWNIFSL